MPVSKFILVSLLITLSSCVARYDEKKLSEVGEDKRLVFGRIKLFPVYGYDVCFVKKGTKIYSNPQFVLLNPNFTCTHIDNRKKEYEYIATYLSPGEYSLAALIAGDIMALKLEGLDFTVDSNSKATYIGDILFSGQGMNYIGPLTIYNNPESSIGGVAEKVGSQDIKNNYSISITHGNNVRIKGWHLE